MTTTTTDTTTDTTTPTQSAKTDEMLAEGRALGARLDAAIAALPDPDDLAIPNERRRVAERERLLSGARSALAIAMGRLPDLARWLTAERAHRDLLRACEIELTRALAVLEALPSVEQNYRQIGALRESLTILQRGPAFVGGESMPPVLWQWLDAHTRSTHGAFFERGGLRMIEATIAALEQEQTTAQTVIEAALASAAGLVPSTAPSA